MATLNMPSEDFNANAQADYKAAIVMRVGGSITDTDVRLEWTTGSLIITSFITASSPQIANQVANQLAQLDVNSFHSALHGSPSFTSVTVQSINPPQTFTILAQPSVGADQRTRGGGSGSSPMPAVFAGLAVALLGGGALVVMNQRRRRPGGVQIQPGTELGSVPMTSTSSVVDMGLNDAALAAEASQRAKAAGAAASAPRFDPRTGQPLEKV